MAFRTVLCGVALVAVFQGHAEQGAGGEVYVCKAGADERKILVKYHHPSDKVPCEVVYEKPGESKALWWARNESGYCESKAAAFAEKHRGWGFNCERVKGEGQ